MNGTNSAATMEWNLNSHLINQPKDLEVDGGVVGFVGELGHLQPRLHGACRRCSVHLHKPRSDFECETTRWPTSARLVTISTILASPKRSPSLLSRRLLRRFALQSDSVTIPSRFRHDSVNKRTSWVACEIGSSISRANQQHQSGSHDTKNVGATVEAKECYVICELVFQYFWKDVCWTIPFLWVFMLKQIL